MIELPSFTICHSAALLCHPEVRGILLSLHTSVILKWLIYDRIAFFHHLSSQDPPPSVIGRYEGSLRFALEVIGKKKTATKFFHIYISFSTVCHSCISNA
jgi:hypothetical protein